MTCEEADKLIHGYVDGELDLVKNLEIDQHLQECPTCAQAYTELQALRAAIKKNTGYFEVPANLHNRIRSSIRRTRRAGPAGPPRWLAVAASVLIVLTAGWGLFFLSGRAARVAAPEQLVLASYVRSEMLPSHRLDIESTNQHTVKPWFAGKVDFAPLVPDLADQDFPLIGGRLDYLDDRSVAVVVYKRRKHVIDLFIWPSAPRVESPRAQTRQGYHLFHWSQSGMSYWAVSDLNPAELQDFVQLVQQRAP